MAEKNSRSPLPLRLDEIFGKAECLLLDQLSKIAVFRLEPLPGATPDAPGYATSLKERVIYFNPFRVQSDPRYRVFACFAHELGHHFPDVQAFQDRCDTLSGVVEELLPKKLSVSFRKRLSHNLMNVLADVLLESRIPQQEGVMGKQLFESCFRENRGMLMLEGPLIRAQQLLPQLQKQLSEAEPHSEVFLALREQIECFQEQAHRAEEKIKAFESSQRQIFPWAEEDFKFMPRYLQYLNLYLIGAFLGFPPEDFLDDDLKQVFGELKVLIAELKGNKMGEEKGMLYIKAARHLETLLKKDLEDLKDADDPAQAFRDFEKQMEGALKEIESVTEPDQSEGEIESDRSVETQQPLREVLARRKQFRDALQGGDAILDEAIVKKAKELGVEPQVYQQFLNICKLHEGEIQSLTEVFTKYILRQFSDRVERNQSSGFMIQPGRAVETYLRHRGGELDPPTRLDRVVCRGPKTLQLYMLVDTSGSMKFDIENTLAYYTVLAASAHRIHEELLSNPGKYNLDAIHFDRAPLEIEIVGFDSEPMVLIEFTGNVSEKVLVQGYQQLQKRIENGGATDDVKALRFEHKRMRLHDASAVKILSMLTDGYGVYHAQIQAGRKPIQQIDDIIREIEEDPSVTFLVTGVGETGEGVKDSYQKIFRPTYGYKVFANWRIKVQDAITDLIQFLTETIEKEFGEE